MNEESDFYILDRTPGYFGCQNDGADWLESHPNDPYHMAHKLMNAMEFEGHPGRCDTTHFMDYWHMARQIKGFEPLEEINDQRTS